MKYLVLILFVLLSCTNNKVHKEEVYQAYFAEKAMGEMNYKLPDNSTIDILTKFYVIEITYPEDLYEAIGKALFQSIIMNKLPGIVVIVETEEDVKAAQKLLVVATRYNITVWAINDKFELYGNK
jgi:serine kinase of HPr protein (carbohydrate metabolism regulator)